MYISAPSFHSGLGLFAQPPAPANCPADLPIDLRTALLYSNLAPLAGTRTRGCDHKAIWSFVPSQRPNSLSVFIYLHGNNNAVPVDASRTGGRAPDWAPERTGSALRSAHGVALVPGAPVAAGPKYALDAAAQASVQRPVVLVPEDVVPPGDRSRFWAVGNAGTLHRPSQLGAMVNDCFQRLHRLRPHGSPSGSAYLGPADVTSVRRLFLAGHSGGGVPLAPSAVSTLALTVPTDLWLYDCTYGPRNNPSYVHFCRHWRARGLLGNDARSSRMAIFVTSDPLTTSVAGEIVHTLRQPFTEGGTRFPGFTYARLTGAGRSPMAPRVDIVEAMPSASVPQIEMALRTTPVVFVHTGVAHDHIPFVWTPRLFDTAAIV
jgi:hypothetical protein